MHQDAQLCSAALYTPLALTHTFSQRSEHVDPHQLATGGHKMAAELGFVIAHQKCQAARNWLGSRLVCARLAP